MPIAFVRSRRSWIGFNLITKVSKMKKIQLIDAGLALAMACILYLAAVALVRTEVRHAVTDALKSEQTSIW